MHEHVISAVRVPRHQTRRPRPERHIPAVTTDRRVVAVPVRLRTVRRHAHPTGRTRLAIEHEHVRAVVRVPHYQVRRPRRERHVAAVTAHHSLAAVAAPLHTRRRHTHPCSGARCDDGGVLSGVVRRVHVPGGGRHRRIREVLRGVPRHADDEADVGGRSGGELTRMSTGHDLGERGALPTLPGRRGELQPRRQRVGDVHGPGRGHPALVRHPQRIRARLTDPERPRVTLGHRHVRAPRHRRGILVRVVPPVLIVNMRHHSGVRHELRNIDGRLHLQGDIRRRPRGQHAVPGTGHGLGDSPTTPTVPDTGHEREAHRQRVGHAHRPLRRPAPLVGHPQQIRTLASHPELPHMTLVQREVRARHRGHVQGRVVVWVPVTIGCHPEGARRPRERPRPHRDTQLQRGQHPTHGQRARMHTRQISPGNLTGPPLPPGRHETHPARQRTTHRHRTRRRRRTRIRHRHPILTLGPARQHPDDTMTHRHIRPRGSRRSETVHEHVVGVVRVPRHQTRRRRGQRHVPAVTADRRRPAGTVALDSLRGHAHPRRRTRHPVVHEHVVRVVRVTGNQIRRRIERHKPAVPAHHRAIAVAGPLHARRGHTHPRRRTRHPIMHEHVPATVRVTGHQIRRRRIERHKPAVPAHHRAVAGAGPLHARRGHAHPTRRTRHPVEHEHVRLAVRVPRHQIRRIRIERHIPAVPAHHRAVAGAGPLHARRGHAHPTRRTRHPVEHEHVRLAVRVPRHQIRRIRPERHVPAVPADRRVVAVPVRLRTVRRHAHPTRRTRHPVVDEHVVGVVRVPRHQVRRRRVERHVPAVATDRRVGAVSVGLHACRGHAHPRDRPRYTIADEHVHPVVRVPRHEVRRRRVECHIPAVPTHRSVRAVAARLRTGRRHAHPARGPAQDRSRIPRRVVRRVHVPRSRDGRRVRHHATRAVPHVRDQGDVGEARARRQGVRPPAGDDTQKSRAVPALACCGHELQLCWQGVHQGRSRGRGHPARVGDTDRVGGLRADPEVSRALQRHRQVRAARHRCRVRGRVVPGVVVPPGGGDRRRVRQLLRGIGHGIDREGDGGEARTRRQGVRPCAGHDSEGGVARPAVTASRHVCEPCGQGVGDRAGSLGHTASGVAHPDGVGALATRPEVARVALGDDEVGTDHRGGAGRGVVRRVGVAGGLHTDRACDLGAGVHGDRHVEREDWERRPRRQLVVPAAGDVLARGTARPAVTASRRVGEVGGQGAADRRRPGGGGAALVEDPDAEASLGAHAEHAGMTHRDGEVGLGARLYGRVHLRRGEHRERAAG